MCTEPSSQQPRRLYILNHETECLPLSHAVVAACARAFARCALETSVRQYVCRFGAKIPHIFHSYYIQSLSLSLGVCMPYPLHSVRSGLRRLLRIKQANCRAVVAACGFVPSHFTRWRASCLGKLRNRRAAESAVHAVLRRGDINYTNQPGQARPAMCS